MARTGVFVLVFYELKRPISGFAGKPRLILVLLRVIVCQNVDFSGQEKKTFDVTFRFLMSDMRWKALDRAMNLS